jgi:acylpyruvate hydrolase
MKFHIAAVIAFLSQFVTLEPGDIIATSTQSDDVGAAGRYLAPGDVLQASISEIGTLENPVEAEDSD